MKKVVMLVAILFGTSVMVNATTPKKQEVKQETKKELRQEAKHAKKARHAKKVAVKTEAKAEMGKTAAESNMKK
ncbi:hypothetical protein [Flavobacterium sp.]